MTLDQLVTDLATSQQLKDAGFPQDFPMQLLPYEPITKLGGDA